MDILANKYRPKSWADVIGQNPIVSVLQRQVATKTFKHAYLFSGNYGCVDKDTEYFNGKEWKPISEYAEGERVLQYNPSNRTAELVEPTRYIKLPCDTLHLIRSMYGLDMCISDEHRVVYESSKGNINVIQCDELLRRMDKGLSYDNYKFLTTFGYSGKGIDLTDAQIKVMCAVICDGSFNKDNKTTWCMLNLKKKRKIDEARDILSEAEIPFTETKQDNGYTRFYFHAPRREKTFTEYWYNCSSSQLAVICNNILKWDGSVTKNRMRFSSTDKATIDFVQFAFASCGYRSSIRIDGRVGKLICTKGKAYKRLSVAYDLIITPRNRVRLPKSLSYIDIPTTDGYKYCFTVPSSMWVMRRNGHILITGNCGKTTVARIFANDINNGQGEPIEIDAASNNGVDNIRKLAEAAQEAPLDGEYNVIILDEVHMLSSQAWAAALKLVEEPPACSIFIFCTTNPEKIPETIMSRVQRFDFKRVPHKLIADRLEYVMNEELHSEYERDALERIAVLSGGHVRNALQYLERCTDISPNVTLDLVETTFGLVKREVVHGLVSGLIAKNSNKCYNILQKVQEHGDFMKLYDELFSYVLSCEIYALTHNIEFTELSTDTDKDFLSNIDKTDIKNIRRAFESRRAYLDSATALPLIRIIINECCE